MDYTQPDFYRFSEDSIIMSKVVCAHIKEKEDPFHLLDVGCGCGVIGIEIMRQAQTSRTSSLVLLEKQREFLPYIQKNRSQFLWPELEVEILNQNFLDFKSQRSVTHIVTNPPYFLEGQGRASPNIHKQHCRSWDKLAAFKFLKHFFCTCRHHQAQGFLCGRSELQTLMEEARIPYKLLSENRETNFYLLV